MGIKENKSALIVFAREPKDGKVKTRLSRDLPVSVVTKLYKAFVRDVLKSALKVKCDQRFIYYAGSGSSIPFLRASPRQFTLKRQTGKDLGERMYKAIVQCQKNHFNRFVIIGTDCVTLTVCDIETALKKLNTYDCVIGPSKDGGYYLIALKSPNQRLFEGIDWGTSSVLQQTVRRTKRMNMKTFFLRKQGDIDTIIHLKELIRQKISATTAFHTQKILSQLTFVD